MLNIRIIILSIVLIFAIAAIGYLTVAPVYAITTESGSETCVGTASLSIQELKDIINGRYQRRCCGLPY